jgi:transglutaminase-like putative cysteine protease
VSCGQVTAACRGRDWVLQRTKFAQNTSSCNTSAIDTLIETVGACRDFALLMIALCRAVNIPARFATGIDYGAVHGNRAGQTRCGDQRLLTSSDCTRTSCWLSPALPAWRWR